MPETNLSALPTFETDSNLINIVIETQRGSGTKMKYDDHLRAFRVEKTLPLGMVFPFAFGFVPSTKAGDGDPLDVLVMGEAELPWGGIVLGNAIAVMECEQRANGKTERNDRVIAVPLDFKKRQAMLPRIIFDNTLRHAIIDFFIKYNELQRKEFRVLGFHGQQNALEIIRDNMVSAKTKIKRVS
ncbi:MAG TPA: inorganic diphosphatase [Candidatus Acidoferrales bacterium]|jgi:inorganic pyrophosphatase|nr:inorganic diphosphatase [Candidatus Acidoferrales bacterium]